jgi:tRNA(Arg) A34 adenosine deaminase TadA
MSRKHHIVARAFDKRGRLIARAINSYRQTHPIQAKYATLAGFPARVFLHAEIACLLRAGTCPVHTMTIERYYANGEPALAKPCPICTLAISDWGVKYVEYTQ